MTDDPIIRGGQGRTPEELESSAWWLALWTLMFPAFALGVLVGTLFF